MNDTIRAAINRELEGRGMTRIEAAQRAGLTRQYLTDMLNGRKGEVPPSWAALLNALELELVVKPKATGEASRFGNWDREEP